MPFTSLLHTHPSGIRYSLQWLYWVLPDLRSRKLTWGWGSLLSRNPAHSAVPIALRMKFPFLDSIAGLELPEVCHMLMDLVWLHTFFFPEWFNAPAGFSSPLTLSDPGSLVLLVRMSQHVMKLGVWIMTYSWKNVRTQRNLKGSALLKLFSKPYLWGENTNSRRYLLFIDKTINPRQ